MKTVLFLLLFPVVLSAQDASQGFTITGKIAGLGENSVVTLVDVNNNIDTLARTLVKK